MNRLLALVLASTLAFSTVASRARADEDDADAPDASLATSPRDGILRPNLDASDDASAATLAEQQSACSMGRAPAMRARGRAGEATLFLAAAVALAARRRRKELYKSIR